MKLIFRGTRFIPVRFFSAFLVLILLCCLLAQPVFARPVETKTVRVGYYENEVFEEGAEEGAVKTGYAYEYYLKLSEYTGWKYEYVYGSFTDLYQMLLDGKIDLLAGLAYREDRDGLILYPEQRMGTEVYNLVKHEDDSAVSADPQTLSGVSIGVLNSAMVDVLNRYLADHMIEANIVIFDDYDSLFAAFDAKEVDVLAAEGDGAYGRDHAEVIGSFGSSDYYLCVASDRPDLMSELNRAQTLLEAEEPGYLNSLQNKYYPGSMSSRAFSEAEREWLDSNDTLKIGYLENYLPYSDTDKDGKVTGMIKDLMPEIFKRLGITNLSVEYHGYENYQKMTDDMREGVIDAAFPVGGGLYYSEENGIYQSTPVTTISTELVFLGDFSENTETNFAVNSNNQMQYYYIKTYYPDAKITYYNSIDECLNAVVSGEVTCTTLNGLRAPDIVRNAKYRKLSLRQLAYVDDRCFGVEIGNEGLLKLLNRGISVLARDYSRDLAYRYTEGLFRYSLLDLLRDHFGLFLTAILVVLGLIILAFLRDSKRKKKQIEIQENSRLKLEEKNRELAESQKALSEALIAAEHANNAKTMFLNNMSHDIRTPMNAIVGFTAMAATHIDNKEQVQDYLSKISVSSRHLLSLINDVLDMSRIESGKMKLEETEVHLPDMIHDLRTIVHSNITAKQLELFIDTQDVKNEDIITDKLRLSQVLLNILTNAVKFTPTGGMISFRVIEKPCEIEGMTSFEFRIKDNGIGMSEEFQKNIFDAFSRERTSTVSGIQGTGLGMAITKNIVDMMNGTITVTSKQGKGSEFVVNIPCRIGESARTFESLDELKGFRALVADDDTHTCLSVCAMLRDIGMRPDWTNYGKEAVIRAKEAYDQSDKFRVYIIDWLMPDQNGIETVRQIRRVIGNDDPIIILTAYDWADIEAEARDAGVTGFVSKPLFMSELRTALAAPFHIEEENSKEEEKKVDFSGKRILLAEDNELNSIIAVSVLESSGFEVEVAKNGEIAVSLMEEKEPGYYDVVLMDIQMPVMDGYEAAKRIRNLPDEKKAKIPIIAVTANAFEEDRKVAIESGMNGHLAKPYDIPEMLKLLGEILL